MQAVIYEAGKGTQWNRYQKVVKSSKDKNIRIRGGVDQIRAALKTTYDASFKKSDPHQCRQGNRAG